MKHQKTNTIRVLFRGLRTVILASVLAGITVDFLFNGVFIKLLFQKSFTEKLIFIYGPFHLAMAGTYFTLISHSRWRIFSREGVMAFVGGILAGHLWLAGHHTTWVYEMIPVSGEPMALLQSKEWPQILFITGEKVREDLNRHPSHEPVPVSLSVVTDYGCIRSAVVETIDHIDVKNDHDANWTWRLNRFATTEERNGPGMEDLRFPWCRHTPGVKLMEDGPVTMRPWDALLEKTGS